MPLEHHDLVHEFPEHRDTIHTLKTTNKHFQSLFNKYHDLTNEVENIEKAGSKTSDDNLEQLKKARLQLKDELFQIIKQAA